MSLIGATAPPETPDHLYTFVDVNAHFADLAVRGDWPNWLWEVDGFWDQVDFCVANGVPKNDVWDWLELALGSQAVDRRRKLILLDNDRGADPRTRVLPIVIRRSPQPTEVVRSPRFENGRVTLQASTSLPRPDDASLPHGVAMCAFHSFRGGAGRTLHCVAVAQSLAARGIRVLLVDGNLEAPGLAWPLETAGIRIEFSWEDMLALLHGAAGKKFKDAMSLGRTYVSRQQVGGVFIMPARRDHPRLSPTYLTPTNVQSSPNRSAYLITETLADLAHRLDAETVLVDLPAGVSELSAPVLLDPRVHRVFVSTANNQSVRGTRQLLDEMTRKAPALAVDPPMTVILTQFPRHDQLELQRRMLAQAPQTLLSPFDSSLLAFPTTWTEVADTVLATGLADVVRPLVDQIATVAHQNPREGTG